jgi:hypothetical protein
LAQQSKKIRIIIILLLFVIYFIAAARPIPRETILAHKWISSLEVESLLQSNSSLLSNSQQANTAASAAGGNDGQLIPFTLGARFGYVDPSGNFAVNKVKTGGIYLGENLWTEYGAQPATIEIKNMAEETVVSVENMRGYPVLLDNRIFILGSEQNVLSEIDSSGNVLWTYEFGAPLTCIDAAAGLVLTGSIDGIIEIIDSRGRRIFYFEPGGSRYAVIMGCAISRNGSRIGVVSGVDQQRFLFLERYGGDGDYKVVYHEFLDTGFRRPVRVSFIDEDRRLVFERSGGIGCLNIKTRQGIRIPLDGKIAAIDSSGDNGVFFLINSRSPQLKELIGIRLPNENWTPFSKQGRSMSDAIFIKAPFKSESFFLRRTGSILIAGGGSALISFNLEEK